MATSRSNLSGRLGQVGLIRAAELLGIDPELTNSFLESYNGRIKGKYFEPYQHGGRLPHLDI